MQKKRDAMIAKLRADFTEIILVGCMMHVFKIRRERAGLNADNFRLENSGQLLDEFLQSLSIRQLKLVREMAKGARIEVEKVTDQEIKELEKSEELITEVVEPPTEH
jgi:hypothetical protein